MDRVYLGTWQFESLQDAQAQELIDTAHSTGIHKFDTALVYAGGRAETLLGLSTSALVDTIVTKVPATSKQAIRAGEAYPDTHIASALELSTQRLGRVPETVLIHNWRAEWDGSEGSSLLKRFRRIASDRAITSVGISLPNGYVGDIEATTILQDIDYIELPFNDETLDITLDRIEQLALDNNVLVRSLFKHGKDVHSIEQKIQKVLETGASVVIGASRPEQIKEWSRSW